MRVGVARGAAAAALFTAHSAMFPFLLGLPFPLLLGGLPDVVGLTVAGVHQAFLPSRGLRGLLPRLLRLEDARNHGGFGFLEIQYSDLVAQSSLIGCMGNFFSNVFINRSKDTSS